MEACVGGTSPGWLLLIPSDGYHCIKSVVSALSRLSQEKYHWRNLPDLADSAYPQTFWMPDPEALVHGHVFQTHMFTWVQTT